MNIDLFGHQISVELPADPVAFVQDRVVWLLNLLGYEWPVTDTGVLDRWADQWDDLSHQLQAHVDDLQAGINHLANTNKGVATDAVTGYLRGGDSNVHSLHTVAVAAPFAADAYRGASMLITGLRAYVIGQILLDVVSIAAAILSGGALAAVSVLMKQGAKLLINMAIDQAINDLMGA